MRRTMPLHALIATLLLAGCAGGASEDSRDGSIRLLFAGDLMVGRGVGEIAAADPTGLFADVRFVVSDADLAVANLESPLTTRPHASENPNALEADPALASLIADAGFDLLGIANNHAGDAGPGTVPDTVDAVTSAGLLAVGAGPDRRAATAATIIERNDVSVAFLAFDATGAGPTADDGPGVATWQRDVARDAVEAAAERADVVTVGIHGGVEYLAQTDNHLLGLAEQLAGWGADVVWGHGSHVLQPVLVISDGSRHTVAATSLGNLVFDQMSEPTSTGAVLEVLADASGPIAYRIGMVDHGDLRAHFTGWVEPEGDAVLFDGEWWSLVRTIPPPEDDPVSVAGFPWGDVTTAGASDVTGDGATELVVSLRRPYRETLVSQSYPKVRWQDSFGRSAHVGLYRPATFEPIWVAGSLHRPVAALAACDGAIALAFDELDDPGIVATGAWSWTRFGFSYAVDLPGSGSPTCLDVDGDGRTEPAIVERAE